MRLVTVTGEEFARTTGPSEPLRIRKTCRADIRKPDHDGPIGRRRYLQCNRPEAAVRCDERPTLSSAKPSLETSFAVRISHFTMQRRDDFETRMCKRPAGLVYDLSRTLPEI